ncbi:cyclin-dependent kinase inhibitor 3 family protein [Grimontia kaedaensis]|uniref:Cyclin-dependent kinase inhibitor 3 family protein n=1 Tax=Grimontia kaedaensis TaxID=2872157 RepID=A0ABY4X2C7_9GAMM|nr:cyclin-dependent kinase inhibitor 3 family protein [Grimontia kaedaensis]USH05392.1 cyclin-dependent kinase inhibitor 3 family protein [Grimontia kaedaensis]
MTHPTWELPVESGALILTPCPGTKEISLLESLQQLKAQGATAVVTAINEEEMVSKGVEQLGELVQELGMEWFHIVIEDDEAPDATFMAKWEASQSELHEAIANGDKVVMHCMGGSGRTGLLAAHLLLERGWELEDIIRDVQALRPGAFTKQPQIDYIHAFVSK